MKGYYGIIPLIVQTFDFCDVLAEEVNIECPLRKGRLSLKGKYGGVLPKHYPPVSQYQINN